MNKFLVFFSFFLFSQAALSDESSHLVLSAYERTNPLFSGKVSWQLGVGYLVGFMVPDFRLSFGSVSYDSIQAVPDNLVALYPTGTAYYDPESELLRTREGSNPWKFLLYEPGITVTRNIFSLEGLTESVRFGIALGKMTDEKNSIEFSARLFSLETALSYKLGQSGHWGVIGAFSYHAGVLVAESKYPESSQKGRLPVHYYSASFGVLYWL